MVLQDPSLKDHALVDVIGLVITFTGKNFEQGHLGFVHKDSSGKAHIVEVEGAFSACLKTMPANMRRGIGKLLWMNLGEDFSVYEKVALQGLLLDIINKNDPLLFVYGFDTSGKLFDPLTGEFKKVHPGQGLTCATFVAEVFDAAGLPLIDRSTWTRGDRKSIKWQKKMVEILKENKVDPVVVSHQLSQIGSKRYFPEQVAVASQISPRPVKRGQIKDAAKQLKKNAVAILR